MNNNKWWGYQHENGHLQVKRYSDPISDAEITDAMDSPFVLRTYGPFEAGNREDALVQIQRLHEKEISKNSANNKMVEHLDNLKNEMLKKIPSKVIFDRGLIEGKKDGFKDLNMEQSNIYNSLPIVYYFDGGSAGRGLLRLKIMSYDRRMGLIAYTEKHNCSYKMTFSDRNLFFPIESLARFYKQPQFKI